MLTKQEMRQLLFQIAQTGIKIYNDCFIVRFKDVAYIVQNNFTLENELNGKREMEEGTIREEPTEDTGTESN